MMMKLMIVLAALFSTGDSGTVLVHGGRIYTMNPEHPEANAFAYDGAGRILAVGDGDLLGREYPDARRIDLGGRTVVPGFIDAHGHMLNLGLSLMRAQLVGTRSKAEIIERLKTFEAMLPAGAWLLGRGWDQNDWPTQSFPTREDLDRHFPERPVWLTRIDGHAGWANTAAMSAADRDFSGDWQPEGGKILRTDAGEASGIFIDRAMGLIASAVPEPGPGIYARALDLALEKAAAVGLTGVHDAGVSLAVFRIYQARLGSRGAPAPRIYAMADGEGEMMDYLCRHGPIIDPYLTARSVKLYVDGALGSRGAALLDDYADDPGNNGLLIQPKEDLADVVDRAMDCGLQVNTHAIGDRANRIALDLYEQAIARHRDNPGRHRIEHAQVVSLPDLDRFAALGVIASVQPTHATSDMYWAEQRVGPQRIKGAYAWKTLVDSGAQVAFGSDFPVEQPDPLLGFFAAVTRQDLEGWPQGGWRPSERVSRETALAGFTRNAAYAAFQERLVGSLEPGKRADFVVLSDDIMTIAPDRIPETRVLATYIDGQRIFGDPRAVD